MIAFRALGTTAALPTFMMRAAPFKLLALASLLGGALACSGSDVAVDEAPDELRTDRDDTEEAAEGAFECGTSTTCNVKTEYCVKRTTYSDLSYVDRRNCIAGRGDCVTKKTTYRCRELPSSCGETPSCSCLPDAETCTGSGARGLKVSATTDNRD